MTFKFDRGLAAAPIKVSWRIHARTVARLDEMAKKEGVGIEDVVQQILDHVLRGQRGTGQP